MCSFCIVLSAWEASSETKLKEYYIRLARLTKNVKTLEALGADISKCDPLLMSEELADEIIEESYRKAGIPPPPPPARLRRSHAGIFADDTIRLRLKYVAEVEEDLRSFRSVFGFHAKHFPHRIHAVNAWIKARS